MDTPPPLPPAAPLFSTPPLPPPEPKKAGSSGLMIVVIAVAVLVGISILAALAVPAYNSIRKKADETRARLEQRLPEAPLSEAEKEAAHAFAQELLKAVEVNDTEALAGLVDYDVLAQQIFSGFPDSRGMAKGFQEGVNKRAGGIFAEVIGQQGRFVRHWNRDGLPAVTLRFAASGGGAAYFDALISRQKKGGFKVVDLYNYLFGIYISKEARQTTAFVVGADENLLNQIIGRAARKQDFADFSQLTKAGREGRAEDVVSLYHTLSPGMKSQRISFIAYVKALQQLGEDFQDEYVKALEQAREVLGKDVTVDLLLVDRHFLRGDFLAARRAVEASLQVIGEDSFLLQMLGMMHVRLGDAGLAKDALKRAEAMEPDLVDLVDLKMQIHAIEKDYGALIRVVKAFAADTGAEITPEMLSEPVYEGLRQSPEFAAWIAERKKAAP